MYDHGGYALRFVFRHEIHGKNVHVRFFAENFIVIPLEKILRAGQHDGGVRRFYEVDFYAGNDLLKSGGNFLFIFFAGKQSAAEKFGFCRIFSAPKGFQRFVQKRRNAVVPAFVIG